MCFIFRNMSVRVSLDEVYPTATYSLSPFCQFLQSKGFQFLELGDFFVHCVLSVRPVFSGHDLLERVRFVFSVESCKAQVCEVGKVSGVEFFGRLRECCDGFGLQNTSDVKLLVVDSRV